MTSFVLAIHKYSGLNTGILPIVSNGRFFNELMKEVLPHYGIEVIELPRAQAGGRSISASLARNAAVEGDRETLLANIPETTLRFFIGTDD